MQIEECISFLLGKAYQQVNQDARRRLAPYGVTPSQYAMLNVLWERDGASGADLGGRLQFDSATTTGLIDRLEHAGLVERRPDPNDRRVNGVFLTAQGAALEEPLNRVAEAINEDFMGQLSVEEASTLRGILVRVGRVER